MVEDKLYLVGYASGVGGVDVKAGDGPTTLKHSSFMHVLQHFYQWEAMIYPIDTTSQGILRVVSHSCMELAKVISTLTEQHKPFSVIGGDHTSAIGTWSGVYHVLHKRGDIGLIWIDAHMDSHTPETSESGRVHGMPLACLLGYGYPSLTQILHEAPKIKPANTCLIGVRSYEEGEAELLARLNVRVYFMEEVMQRGFSTVLREAVKHVSEHTVGYGLSLDIDVIDPMDAPAVGVPESNGIKGEDILKGLAEIARDDRLIGTEIVEFDPSRDSHQLTERLIVSFLEAIRMGVKK